MRSCSSWLLAFVTHWAAAEAYPVQCKLIEVLKAGVVCGGTLLVSHYIEVTLLFEPALKLPAAHSDAAAYLDRRNLTARHKLPRLRSADREHLLHLPKRQPLPIQRSLLHWYLLRSWLFAFYVRSLRCATLL